MVYYTDEIVGVLHKLRKEVCQPLLFLLHGLNTDSNNFSKPAEFEVPASYTMPFSYHLFLSFLRN